MPQSKERHAEYMREKRGSQKGSQGDGSQPEGSQNWETISIETIKAILLQDIMKYIENVGGRYGLTEQRLRRAYKYHLWHNDNFIDGVHKDSKYRLVRN